MKFNWCFWHVTLLAMCLRLVRTLWLLSLSLSVCVCLNRMHVLLNRNSPTSTPSNHHHQLSKSSHMSEHIACMHVYVYVWCDVWYGSIGVIVCVCMFSIPYVSVCKEARWSDKEKEKDTLGVHVITAFKKQSKWKFYFLCHP